MYNCRSIKSVDRPQYFLPILHIICFSCRVSYRSLAAKWDHKSEVVFASNLCQVIAKSRRDQGELDDILIVVPFDFILKSIYLSLQSHSIISFCAILWDPTIKFLVIAYNQPALSAFAVNSVAMASSSRAIFLVFIF